MTDKIEDLRRIFREHGEPIPSTKVLWAIHRRQSSSAVGDAGLRAALSNIKELALAAYHLTAVPDFEIIANEAATALQSQPGAVTGDAREVLADYLPQWMETTAGRLLREGASADGMRIHAADALRAIQSVLDREAGLRAACTGIDDDYMTSESHHPGHVLIPTDRFERIRAALSAGPQGEEG